MKKRRLFTWLPFFVLFSIHSAAVFSQPVDTLYMNDRWQITEKPFASYYRFGHIVIDSFWYYKGPVTDYYINGDLQMQGRYSAGGVKHGPFFFFYPGNVVMARGNYENNQMKGIWEYYYNTGKPRLRIDYTGDGKDFTVLEYYDSTGKALTQNANGSFTIPVIYQILFNKSNCNLEGEFKNGLRHGTWKYYGDFIPYNATQPPVLMKEVYDKGEFKRAVTYYGNFGESETSRTKQDKVLVKEFEKISITEYFQKDRAVFRNTKDDQDLMDYITKKKMPEQDVSAESFEESFEGVLRRLNTPAIIRKFNEPSKIYNGEIVFKLSDSGDIENVEITGNLTDKEKEQMGYFLGTFKNIKEIIVDNIGIDAYHKIYFYSLVFAEFIPRRDLYLFPESQFVFAFIPYDKLKELFKKKKTKQKNR